MKIIHLLPLALVLPVLIVLAAPADAYRGEYRVYLEKTSFKYGDPFEYTIEFSGLHDSATDTIKARIINKSTAMASEWSYIKLEGSKTKVTTDIIDAPFDKKGTYILQTLYNPPRLFAYGGGEFELLDDADPETSQSKTHFLSITEQINAQIPFSEIVCKQGLQLQLKGGWKPVCLKEESVKKLIKRQWINVINDVTSAQFKKEYKPVSIHSPTLLLDTWPNQVPDTNIASDKTGLNNFTPTYLPAGYEIQKIAVDENIDVVHLFISKYPISREITTAEFEKQGGIHFNVSSIKYGGFSSDMLRDVWVYYDAKYQRLNEKNILYHDITKGEQAGQEIDVPAELSLYDDNTHIAMSGFIPVDELIKIAESIK